MKRFSLPFLWLIVLALALPPGLSFAQAHAADSLAPPEIDGWVQISTADQLIYTNDNQELYVAKNMKLLNDIELPAGSKWTPFGGNGVAEFSGVFDGGGHRVSGITIDEEDANYEYAGFFGQASGTIKNISVSVDIKGGAYSGGLVGYLSGGNVDRSYSSGIVQGRRNAGSAAVAGGLVGSAANASISRSYSTASVISGTASNIYSGGLAGSLGRGDYRDVFARGGVTANNGTYVFSSGLSAFLIYGGLERAYATGRIESANSEGVLYSTFKGLIAQAGANGQAVNAYFDTDTTGMAEDAAGGIGMTTVQMKDPSNYSEAWDFANTWTTHADVNDGYPYLKHEIVTSELPPALKDVPYSAALGAFEGADVTLNWSAAGLPSGLSLNGTGTLQGTPGQAGTFNVEVTASDAGGQSARKIFQLVVREAAPELSSFSVQPGKAFGTTLVNAVPGSEERLFYYTFADSPALRPLVGDPVPAEAAEYEPGSDIPSAAIGRILTVYESDSQRRIQAWQSVELEGQHIQSSVGAVTGRVAGAGGSPLSGAAITAGDLSATTDEQGSFTFPIVAEGDLTLRVSADGYESKDVAIIVAAGTTADAGTITLKAIETAPPPSLPPLQQGDTFLVMLNGTNMQLPVKKERDAEGRSVLRLIADTSIVNALFKTGEIGVVEIQHIEPVVKLDLPASALKAVSDEHRSAALELRISGASYRIPLRFWPSIPETGVITIAIAKASPNVSEEVKGMLSEQGYEMLASLVDFTTLFDGAEMTGQGQAYTVRTIALDSPADPGVSAVVRIDGSGQPHFIPSVFHQVKNGGGEAEFYAPHNSLYTVVRSERTYSDIQDHWAQDDIELLANKLIVKGDSEASFRPEDTITRAEFAAMLVRSLGLSESARSASFIDTDSNDWYAGAAAAAAQAGLVTGYEDGSFRPDAPITREQMAVMLDRAIAFVGRSSSAHSAVLEPFQDADAVSDWAKASIARLVESNVMRGVSNDSLSPQSSVTRAQCAAALKRMLQSIHFIQS